MFTRKCPKCGKELSYKAKQAFKKFEKLNALCRSCTKKGHKDSDETRAKKSTATKGQNNPMAGRSVYSVWLEKYGKEEADLRRESQSKKIKGKKIIFAKPIEERNYLRGVDNKMKNGGLLPLMIKKYGKEEADKKWIEFKQKQSKNSTGSNNPMFGKPSPMGSGNGWKGWYKGFFFRSIMEASFLKYLFDNNITFESAENNKFKIEYFDTYRKRNANYFPDYYLTNSKEIIEVKPLRLTQTINNKDKFEAARKKYGNKFKIMTQEDFHILTNDEIRELKNNRTLRFQDRYEQKYLEANEFVKIQ